LQSIRIRFLFEDNLLHQGIRKRPRHSFFGRGPSLTSTGIDGIQRDLVCRRVVERHRRHVMLKDRAQRAGDGDEQVSEAEIRNQCIVDFQQETHTIAFLYQPFKFRCIKG
jgi:hypothetical protein